MATLYLPGLYEDKLSWQSVDKSESVLRELIRVLLRHDCVFCQNVSHFALFLYDPDGSV
jgi:hypothetical protein